MSSKLFSRSGVFVWSPRGVETKGLIVADFAQFFDPNATSVEQKIDFLAANQLFEQANLTASGSVNTNYRFNELAWSSMCSDDHPNGIFAGGTEDGTVVFFDANAFVKQNRLEVLSARKDHHGHVLTIDVSRDARWMASGGGSGQILLWDCANLKTPFSPGTPNFQDQVKIVRWNQKNESVFASISSRRVSCWDLRRNGAPVLEFAEIPGCDWSSLCWNPCDASQLIVGSQSQQVSVIQKWDSRFTSTPIREYRHHTNGITSIDWNKSDDRLLISSGCDGQVILWDHENSEVIGGVGSLQGDWVRSVKWNEVEPDQFAIQYFQHPLQIGSLTSLGAPQPGAEVLAARVTDQFVPAWHRAPLIGSSMALGGRLATFWRSYDQTNHKWIHNVEVETIRTESAVGAEDIANYLRMKEDKRNLGWYLHERAYSPKTEQTDEEQMERMVWLSLLGVLEGGGRTKTLKCLELVEEETEYSSNPTSHATTTVDTNTSTALTQSALTHSARSTSAISAEQNEVEPAEPSLIDKCSGLDWRHLDSAGWDLVTATLRQDHLTVIRVLMTSRQHVAAMMYAAQHLTEQLPAILDDFNKITNNTNPLSTLALALNPSYGSDSNASDEQKTLRIEEILKTFPDEKWRELLGLIVAHEGNLAEIHSAISQIGTHWLKKGESKRACIAFIISGDVDNLLLANTSFSTADRVRQSFIVHKMKFSGKEYPPGMEKFVIETAHALLAEANGEVAWELVKWAENGSAELQELMWTCYQVAGGKNCTPDAPPENPYDVRGYQQQNKQQIPQYQQYSQQQIRTPPPISTNGYQSFGQYPTAQPQAPPIPQEYQQRRNSNLPPPMPPSSQFYQAPPSWNQQQQAPPMPSNMPPPKPSTPVTPGWNDPPPMAFKQPVPNAQKTNVMQVNWKPVEVAPSPGGMMVGTAGMMQYQNVMAGMQGMSLQNGPPSASSTVSSSFPSPNQVSPAQPAAQAPPIQLSPEDEKIMEPIVSLAQQICETARVQAKIDKSNELKARIQAELAPRLAANRLSPETKHHLMTTAYFISMRQIREAQASVAQMARNASDFVEISSFLPALKSLLSLATH